jgi:hypothetical protein
MIPAEPPQERPEHAVESQQGAAVRLPLPVGIAPVSEAMSGDGAHLYIPSRAQPPPITVVWRLWMSGAAGHARLANHTERETHPGNKSNGSPQTSPRDKEPERVYGDPLPPLPLFLCAGHPTGPGSGSRRHPTAKPTALAAATTLRIAQFGTWGFPCYRRLTWAAPAMTCDGCRLKSL